jgi:hypothetical protein
MPLDHQYASAVSAGVIDRIRYVFWRVCKLNPNVSKSSQAGPSSSQIFPRKRLGFPWISLSELSLFKRLS